jgi:hypothetical protein
MIIIKTAEHGGGQTRSMPQHVIQGYLQNVINDPKRQANLSQALNQAFNGQGKACGTLKYDGFSPLHASAGKAGVSSITLFYYEHGGLFYLFAMGEHKDSSSYTISHFGPADGDFKQGKVVRL